VLLKILQSTKYAYFDLKCNKIAGGWAPSGPAEEAHSALSDPLAGFRVGGSFAAGRVARER